MDINSDFSLRKTNYPIQFITGTSTDGSAYKVMLAVQLINKTTLEMCVKIQVAVFCWICRIRGSIEQLKP
jgi:hypothetical protein